MKVIKSEHILPVDVDSTLILYDYDATLPDVETIFIPDPYDATNNIAVKPHTANIKLLKEKHTRNYKILVWSQGGFQWAEAVVRALHLEEYVDLIMTKPHCYIDDLPCTEWMGSRLYLKPGVDYKGS